MKNYKMILSFLISFFCGNFLNKALIISLINYLSIHLELVIGLIFGLYINFEQIIKKFRKKNEEVLLFRMSFLIIGITIGIIIQYSIQIIKIRVITVNIFGGIGNQMFQYALGRSLSVKLKTKKPSVSRTNRRFSNKTKTAKYNRQVLRKILAAKSLPYIPY